MRSRSLEVGHMRMVQWGHKARWTTATMSHNRNVAQQSHVILICLWNGWQVAVARDGGGTRQAC